MVDKLYASIAHEHKKKFLPSPTEHPTIRLLMRAIRRHLARPRQPVEPLGPHHLLQINKHLQKQGSNATLELWRTIWRANIQYYSACRFSEINSLSDKEIKIDKQPSLRMSVTLKQSKTDQHREGLTKYIFPVPSEPLLCPIQLTQNYLLKLSAHLTPGQTYQGFLQPKIRFCRQTCQQIPLPTEKIGYSSCLDETRQLLQSLKIPGRFGEHSGRRGAATQAAANGGSLLDIQTLGNWKNGSNAQLYVDSSRRQSTNLSKLLLPN